MDRLPNTLRSEGSGCTLSNASSSEKCHFPNLNKLILFKNSHQHFGLPDFFSNLADAGLLAVLHGEVAGASGNLEQEGPQHLHASLCQVHLGVELGTVQLLLLISDP